MGKPYLEELSRLQGTGEWALRLPIEKFKAAISDSLSLPLVVVGSGGSLTAAHMAARLHQAGGTIAKAVTPLELVSSGTSLRDASVLILSAGGRNPDIQMAIRFVAGLEPLRVNVLSMRSKSPLSALAAQNKYIHFLGVDPPTKKDGFLATNSLIALLVILLRSYNTTSRIDDEIASILPRLSVIPAQISSKLERVLDRDSWIVLHGAWGTPAAIDAESKFSESALKHVQIVDYRNFAHGRHYWLTERKRETGVIALITPGDGSLPERTLQLLPKDVPVLKLKSSQHASLGGFDLILDILHLVGLVGKAAGIDPGKPDVPLFGRRIYHLRHSPRSRDDALSKQSQSKALLKKSKLQSLSQMSPELHSYWAGAHAQFVERLQQTQFSSLVVDYDGTLCDPSERYDVISIDVANELKRLLKNGVLIGIATGRGRSVRESLQVAIPENYWHRILIGYYNGADIGTLDQKDHPVSSGPLHPSLLRLKELLDSNPIFHDITSYECRPRQISLMPYSQAQVPFVKAAVADFIRKGIVDSLQMVESSHSIDVIPFEVSKLLLVDSCKRMVSKAQNPANILCIGDKGAWPGNDYELLSAPFSLSVDTVSPDPNSCWDLSPVGYRGVQATREYLRYMKASSGLFSFTLPDRGKKG